MLRLLVAAVVALQLLSPFAGAAVQTRTVKYQDGETECVGMLAWDDTQQGPRPTVMVIHEWWGLDDYAKGRARQLAELGYAAFCVDMYGSGKVVDHPADAGKMAGMVRSNLAAWRQRAQAGIKAIHMQPECDANNVAAMGYCFGGSTALQLAYSGAGLKAVATFHAALPEPTAAEAVATKAQVLVCHGGADTFIPDEAIQKFRKALDGARVKYEFVSYPGVKHSFTVPHVDQRGIDGLKYDATADADSWKRLQALLKQTFPRS